MKKKILKIVGLFLLLIIGLLIAAPFILEAKIGDIIKNNVNNNVNATLDFSDARLSLISSFPNAEVGLEDVTLINNAPFKGDTLFYSEKVELKMGIGELFKSPGQTIGIKSLIVDGAKLNITVDEAEKANYDIALESESETVSNEEEAPGFQLNLESYEITNTNIAYWDKAAGMSFELSDFQHRGTGDLSLKTSELQTQTESLVSFAMDSTKYLNKNKIKLDALIGIDLKENKYSFLKNEALINQLPLVFDGFIKLNDNNQEVDISFKTPSSDFKNFLAVIPQEYSKNIKDVKTTGNFELAGKFEGIVDETHIPKFNIKINSENASFKYPDLPKSVRNVFIDAKINNTTGIAEDTYVDIGKLSFMIDEDKFGMTAQIKELMGNTKIGAHIKGQMNLANISKAYPMPSDLDLKGLLNADITTAFDMLSVEKGQYENTKTSGSMSMTDFEYNSAEIPNPVKLNKTALTFNPKTVSLNELEGATGKTDFNATGTIDNFLGFMFNDEKMVGDFNLKSNVFALNDFMVAEEETTADEKPESESKEIPSDEKIKIPSFLDANVNAAANTVLYDNITLKDVKGNLRIKDEKAVLNNMTSAMLGGQMAFNGEVSTKQETPVFAMRLGMKDFGISESFKVLELFKTLAPIAGILQGKLNSDIELSGNLTDDFTPDLASISGKVLAELFATDIKADQASLLTSLGSKLNFIKTDKLDLKGLKTALSFEDGVVKVKPFTVAYEDIAVKVDGSHTFDRKLNYKATLDVPAKYLGSEINNLIAKIDDSSLEGLTIPVVANIGGDYASPAVTTDLASGVKSLTTKLIDIQKQKLINKGKDEVKNLIGDVLNTNSSENDSVKTDPVKDGVKNVIGGILGGGEKDETETGTDSATTKKDEAIIEEKAKDILGGLFGRKKKDSTKKEKDSVQ